MPDFLAMRRSNRLSTLLLGSLVGILLLSMLPTVAFADTYHRNHVAVTVTGSGGNSTGMHYFSIGPDLSYRFSEGDSAFVRAVASHLGYDVAGNLSAYGLDGAHPQGEPDAEGRIEERVNLDSGHVTYKYMQSSSLEIADDGHGEAGLRDASAIAEGEGSWFWPESLALRARADLGYEFDRWECETAGAEVADPTSPEATLRLLGTARDHDVRVVARFRRLDYPVTVTNDGNGTATADMGTAGIGDRVTLSASPNEGYEFASWEVVSPAGLAIDGNIFEMPAAPVEIRAKFQAKAAPAPAPAPGGGEKPEPAKSVEPSRIVPGTGEELPATGDAIAIVVAVSILLACGALGYFLHKRHRA